MNRYANDRDRDERGRFISDNDDDRRYGSNYNRNYDELDERGRFRSSGSQGDSDYRSNSRNDDDYRQPRGGQFGDSRRGDYDQGGYRDTRYDDDMQRNYSG